MITTEDSIKEWINSLDYGLDHHLGLEYTHISKKEIKAELKVSKRHVQPYGLVHGGTYSAIVESLCSAGAIINCLEKNRNAMGIENHTSFLRATKEGTLYAAATPVSMQVQFQTWECKIYNDHDKLCAVGQVRLYCPPK
jgi:uncharacterized protein (TIGR00369 family)